MTERVSVATAHDPRDPRRTIATQEGVRTVALVDDALFLTDQRALPLEERELACLTVEDVAVAIETLAVRGAPAIGGAAALGVALAARRSTTPDAPALRRELELAIARLARTRPTAVNLFVALDAMTRALAAAPDERVALVAAATDAAEAVVRADAAACDALGAHGAGLFVDGDRVLTICHTGALATCGIGTALGALRAAHARGTKLEVFALETRPLLQGARLTAWECQRLSIPVTLLTDGMAGFAMARKGITKAIVGADRIAKNGDTANKIGTYGVATLCRAHGLPFYVAAPSTTYDPSTASGDAIVVEERDAGEVRAPRGTPFAPRDVPVWNPAFDVTPRALVTGYVSERGVSPDPAVAFGGPPAAAA